MPRSTRFPTQRPVHGVFLAAAVIGSAGVVTGSLACPPPATTCPCNWDGVGGLDCADFNAFIEDYFANDPCADFNGSGQTSVQDIFDFKACLEQSAAYQGLGCGPGTTTVLLINNILANNCRWPNDIQDNSMRSFDTRPCFTTDGSAEPTCFTSGGSQIHNDTWFVYSAEATTAITIAVKHPAARVAIYDAPNLFSTPCPSGAAGDLLACADTGTLPGPVIGARLTVGVVAGVSYLIRVGDSGSLHGPGTVAIGNPPPGAIDNRPENEPCGFHTNDQCATVEARPTIASFTGNLNDTFDEDRYFFLPAGDPTLRTRLISHTGDPINYVIRARDSASTCAGPIIAAGETTSYNVAHLYDGAASAFGYTIDLRPGATAIPSCASPLEYSVHVQAASSCKAETELCGASGNNGCDASASLSGAQPLVVGDRICGTTQSTSTNALQWDADWYTFTITGIAQEVSWVFEADFAADLQLWSIPTPGSCAGRNAIPVPPVTSNRDEFAVWLQPGSYAIRIAPTVQGLGCTAGGPVGTYTLHYERAIPSAIDPNLVITSVANGSWDDPSTWDLGVPSAANRVVVRHAVHAPANVPAHLTVREVTVVANGVVSPAPAGDISGRSLYLHATTVMVHSGGAIVGGNGSSSINGGQLLIDVPAGKNGLIMNGGRIAGGNGNHGGELVINAPDSTVSNQGLGTLMVAGAPSGNVSISAHTFENRGALVATGQANASFPIGGTFTIHAAESAGNVQGGLITAYSLVSAQGSRNTFNSGNILILEAGSRIECLTGGSRDVCVNGRNVTLAGTITGRFVCGDPPVLDFGPSTAISAEDIVLAGASLHFNNLGPDAISAANTLTIQATAGGVVDLQSVAGHPPIFFAGGGPGAIVIKANSILTSPGVALNSLFNTPPVVLPGEAYHELCTSPADGRTTVRAGETLVREFAATNCGSEAVTVDLSITDSRGWLESNIDARGIAAGIAETLPALATVRVPASSLAGDSTVVTLAVSINGSSVTRTAEVTYVVDGLVCRADFNASGEVSVQDIFDFLAAFFGGAPAGDFNRSGDISPEDLFAFLTAYFSGCP